MKTDEIKPEVAGEKPTIAQERKIQSESDKAKYRLEGWQAKTKSDLL
jgi:hypothetical protein